MYDETPDWRALAACRDEHPDRMQPEVATPEQVADALSVCDRCPLESWTKCRELATGQVGPYGVHAGQWWGDPPNSPLVVTCEWCGTDVLGTQDTQRYCGTRCRVAAHRARQALSA